MLFWRLILAHLLADFVLQTAWVAEHKRRPKALLLHGLAYLLCSLLLVWSSLDPALALMLLALTALHQGVDFLKDRVGQALPQLAWLWFALDQAAHLLSIAAGLYLVSAADRAFLASSLARLDTQRLVQYLTLMVINLSAGRHVVNLICARHRPEIDGNEDPHALIGIFERLLITLSVLIGRYEVIGFMIAAKSIIRLPDANALDKQSESRAHRMVNYYLIGTFVSYSWAIGWTVLFLRLLPA